VGLRLWEIGSAAPRASRLDEAALPYLQDLHEATHGSIYLAVHQGGYALCVAAVVGRHPVQPAVRAGTRAPLMSPGAGEVLLAHAAPDVIEQALASCAPGPDHSGHRARQRLADIRRSGIAVARNGTSSVVVVAPVYGPPGEVAAALSVAVRPIDTHRVPPRLVRMAAARVSHALGGRHETDLPASEAQGGTRRAY
jgi:DNA-binding IclR family transcriptional regulator